METWKVKFDGALSDLVYMSLVTAGQLDKKTFQGSPQPNAFLSYSMILISCPMISSVVSACLCPLWCPQSRSSVQGRNQLKTLLSLPACCCTAAGDCHPQNQLCRACMCSCLSPGQNHPRGCCSLWDLAWAAATAGFHL